MATSEKTRLKVGGNEYVVSDTRRTPRERNFNAAIGRSKPARSISFKPVGGSPRVPTIVTREDIERKSPLLVSRLTDEETEARRRDRVRADMVKGVAGGFLAERGYAMARPAIEVHRAQEAARKGKPYKPKVVGPTVADQIAFRLRERKTNPYTKAQIKTVVRQSPYLRALPTKKSQRWAAERTGVLDWSGPKTRAIRNARGLGIGLAAGSLLGGYRYARSRQQNKPEYSFRLGTPPGRKVQEVPLV